MTRPTPAWPTAPDLPTLLPGDRVHLVGIGGAGMSGLARALRQQGLRVSGSDRQASPLLERLAAEGIAVSVGHGPELLPADCRLVVHTPAVPADHPELSAARARGIPIAKRAPLLGALMDARQGLAVAGTHGKTTTSAMLAAVLEAGGLQPSWFIGAEIPDLGGNAHLGRGPHLVLEADEYDRSFLHGHPRLAIITNLEHDHPDIYPRMQDLRDAFAAFAARVAPDGAILVCASSAEAWAACAAAAATRMAYHVAGDAEPPPDCRPRWTADILGTGSEGTRFQVRADGEDCGAWQIGLSGRHNVANALAVIAAADLLGVDRGHTAAALAAFRGAERRFQLRTESRGIAVVDDYAHHPTEIAASIAAARERYPDRPVIAVIEPHTYSRVAALADDFRRVFGLADRTLVTPVYAAREAALPGVDNAWLVRDLPRAEAAADLAAAGRRAAALGLEQHAGAVLLFMGAGQIQQASAAAAALLAETDDAVGSPAVPPSTLTTAGPLADLLAAGRAAGLGGDKLDGALLADHASLRVGGPAGMLLRLRSLPDLLGWWRLGQAAGLPVTVLGRGSNVVVRDGGLPGLVLLNRCEAWRLDAAPGREDAELEAESGVTLAALVGALARDGWAGLEAGIGIPGSVGAAVVTNAGAHGWTMADSLVSVRLADRSGAVRECRAEDLALRYRGSALKDRHDQLVLSVRLRLRREDSAAILARIAAFTAARRSSQPRLPSMGSVFKNPPGDHAGRLIEAAGLKGRRRGEAEISSLHANFIVNRGRALAADVLALVELARGAVAASSGIQLESEIEVMGVEDVSAAP